MAGATYQLLTQDYPTLSFSLIFSYSLIDRPACLFISCKSDDHFSSMIYEIHLYVPKTGRLTFQMLDWLFKNGQRTDQPELFWPVRRLKPRRLAQHMLRLDPHLLPVQGPGNDVELHFPDETLGVVLYLHDRGVIVFFPYMSYSIYSRIVLGICYTYIRFLFDAAGFWSYDPQLNVISYADDFQTIEETALLMDKIMPRLLGSG